MLAQVVLANEAVGVPEVRGKMGRGINGKGLEKTRDCLFSDRRRTGSKIVSQGNCVRRGDVGGC
jgi:hypothetical protein